MNMIPRYENAAIKDIWSDEAKLARWQVVELAVIEARVKLGLTDKSIFDAIDGALSAEENEPDIALWHQLDKELKHDLNAFIHERRRFIAPEFQSEFHKDMTSYDTEEPAFAHTLVESHHVVDRNLDNIIGMLKMQAVKYRYTLMLERTHGQGAKLRSFGGRLLTYVAELEFHRRMLHHAIVQISQNSRLSGAIGNYGGGLTPEIELETLDSLFLVPFIGATQIVPRSVFAPLAQSLANLCETFGKMALDFRLGARSGNPLWQEPFGKLQMGSSAMPHKKNTINTEQMGGMAIMARSYATGLASCIQTWEARAIEQSCVERVFWPDLFHVTLRMLSIMEKVYGDMTIYPDNMLAEVHDSRGTYASDEAKNFLAEEFGKRGIDADTAYRVIQLASFDIFAVNSERQKLRDTVPSSAEETEESVSSNKAFRLPPATQSLRDYIPMAELRVVPTLNATKRDVAEWNGLLREVFADETTRGAWEEIFKPSHLLKQEAHIFDHLLND